MNEPYLGTWVNTTDACAILGCTPPTLISYRRKYADFPTRNENKRYLDLDLLEWAGKHAIRTAKIVRG